MEQLEGRWKVTEVGISLTIVETAQARHAGDSPKAAVMKKGCALE